jgi:hypothetical protein
MQKRELVVLTLEDLDRAIGGIRVTSFAGDWIRAGFTTPSPQIGAPPPIARSEVTGRFRI